MLHVLFICSQNKLRSPTAEQVFSNWPGVECTSAGTNKGAENPLTSELVEWADLILVMEKQHQRKLTEKFRAQLCCKRVACLGIADNYAFMEDALVELLQRKVKPYLVRAGAAG
ncbi:low molecular weight protein tyrosine phosphatase family protein [Paucibacter sp. B2R-40]|uniref:low molecular weight protein tyrosine phosphatase family protein n=1 Tax=Paucibacter sp. B2R-40 TaxID=2893554 RepID=UPI0021E4390F|nr:low molecular weight protein tyrosine phosphatase family protein [Paucibacter sp. B2R-40]MCV2355396.1 low molecular weight protein tyrosine phosphatase family protein [Paucibacter sp. B2R-40]